MKQLLRAFIWAGIFVSAVTGCGGGQSDTIAAQNSSSLIVYQFTATIESYVDSWAPFPATVGDVITGTFSYDPNVSTQKAPAGVQVKIGSITLNSDLNSLNSPIVIQNDLQHPPLPLPDGSLSNKSDEFQWITNDTSVAAQYGLDWIQTSIVLEDSTGTVFSDSRIPANLNLSQFNNAFISIGKEV
ncbi:MAG: hypothetical protein NDI77_08400, partial [Geobacteraceae bacterium]|nr:hypothetical protein [Geobacteraceae bacterium]